VSVLLNVDLGELADEPEALYACAHIANVACGGHTGDDASMKRAIDRCRAHRTHLGAHPSYPDREGFGRRALSLSAGALSATVMAQCRRLAALAQEFGQPIDFVKAHGALYHAADRDPSLAESFVGASRQALGQYIVVIGPPGGALADTAARVGVGYAREAFADRGVRSDGSLVPRGEAGALVVDPAAAAARAREIVSRKDIDTVCVHGDTPEAVALATAVRAVLDAAVRA
jgi:UPF0271 protein